MLAARAPAIARAGGLIAAVRAVCQATASDLVVGALASAKSDGKRLHRCLDSELAGLLACGLGAMVRHLTADSQTRVLS